MTSPGVGVPVPPTPRARGIWVIPLLLFLAVLLAAGLAFNLANLDTGGEQMPGPASSRTTSQSPLGLIDSQSAAILLIVTLAALAGTFLLALFLRSKGRASKRAVRPATWADVFATLIAFAVFTSILLVWPRIVSEVRTPVAPGNLTGNATSNLTFVPSAGGIPLGVFLAGAVLASIVAMALFLRVGLNLRRGPPVGPLQQRRTGAAQAVLAAISELQLGGDVRAVILACYERFCYFLGARGIGEQDALTPRELEDLAVARLAVSQDSAESLTSLFEEARYSEHQLGGEDRDRAVRSLERIRADLEV